MAGDVTTLLQRFADGDESVADELYDKVYAELHRIALIRLGKEGPAPTLQPTALVHEAWLRMARARSDDWQSRKHFLAVAARAMRSALVDHARRRNAERRGGHLGRVSLEVALDRIDRGGTDLLALDDALERLASEEPRHAKVVELRFFGGLTLEEVAETLAVSLPTVNRAWRAARIWLREALRPAS